jgi:hypothetical protein
VSILFNLGIGNWHMQGADGAVVVEAPGDYPFHVYDKPSQRSGIII